MFSSKRHLLNHYCNTRAELRSDEDPSQGPTICIKILEYGGKLFSRSKDRFKRLVHLWVYGLYGPLRTLRARPTGPYGLRALRAHGPYGPAYGTTGSTGPEGPYANLNHDPKENNTIFEIEIRPVEVASSGTVSLQFHGISYSARNFRATSWWELLVASFFELHQCKAFTVVVLTADPHKAKDLVAMKILQWGCWAHLM